VTAPTCFLPLRPLLAALALGTSALPALAGLTGTLYPGLGYDLVETSPGQFIATGYMYPSMSYTLPNASGGGTASGAAAGLGAAQLSTGTAFLGYRGMVITPAQTYVLGTLGVNSVDGWTPLGFGSSSAQATNAKNEVAGTSGLYSSDGTVDLGGRAVYYAPGSSEPKMLAVPKGFTDASGVGYMGTSNMSSTGVIIGYGSEIAANGASRVIRWANPTAKGKVLDNVTLGGATGIASWGVAVNAVGDVVGKGNLFSAKGQNLGTVAARWLAGSTQATALLPLAKPARQSYYASATAINDAGVAVGSSAKFSDSGASLGDAAVRWPAGQTAAVELKGLGQGPDGTGWTYALAINKKGVVMGVGKPYSDSGADLGQRAIRWAADSTEPEVLGLLSQAADGGSYSYAFGMNNKGYVVGNANVVGTASGDASNPTALAVHAVVWKPNGTPVDLNKLLPPNSGWQLFSAYSISDTGWITGIGFFQPPGYDVSYSYPRLYSMQITKTD